MSAENPLEGESPLIINGQELTLVYDWAALAKLSKKFGNAPNLFEPETLAAALEIGLKKNHKGVTAAHILEASPPLVDAIAAFNMAMQRAYFGHKGPPKDSGENPLMAAMVTASTTASTASPSPSSTHSEPVSDLPNSGA